MRRFLPPTLPSLPIGPTSLVLAAFLAAGCATSPTGRTQLLLFPEAEMAQMGVAAFDKQKQDTPIEGSAAINGYVDCVARRVTAAVTGTYATTRWEVVVFDSKQVNAFALPGGKIGVYNGLLGVAANQDQLATVIGHEVAHVLASHSNERVSTAFAADTGVQLVSVAAGSTTQSQQQLYSLLGMGAQVGVVLPFGRAQESEADIVGLDLMARAGFDPRESVTLWQNMSKASSGAPPEFLSTHPAHATRIQGLQGRMERALALRQEARAAGRRPDCRPPSR